jgi:O-antigen/teichoic acid export membrane protein
MDVAKALISRTWRHFMRDSLYRNSIYLMLSTYVQAGFGFFFWLIASHLYAPDDVGLATALISAITLLATLSLVGMDNSLIRYLPTSRKPAHFISNALTIVTIASLVVGVVYVFGIGFFSPKLEFIRGSWEHILLTILMTVGAALCTLADYIFMSFRRSGFVLGKGIVLSVAKLGLLFALVSQHAYGLFLAASLGMILAFLFSIVAIKYTHQFKLRPHLDRTHIAGTARFAGANYISGLLESLPASILPILIINQFESKQAAYFYIAFMIANLLYRIPVAVTQSFFAESSSSTESVRSALIRTCKMLFIMLVPAIFVLIIFGKYLLLIFGKSYSITGYQLLIFFSLAAIPVSLGYIFETLLRVWHRHRQLVSSSTVRSVTIIGFSYIFMQHGFAGIGLGWLVGQCIAAVWLLIMLRKDIRTSGK